MGFDVLRAVLEAAKALGAVRGEELLDQVLGVGVKLPGEVNLARENLLVDTKRVLVVERRVARKHLVNQNAKRPPVHRLAVACTQVAESGD